MSWHCYYSVQHQKQLRTTGTEFCFAPFFRKTLGKFPEDNVCVCVHDIVGQAEGHFVWLLAFRQCIAQESTFTAAEYVIAWVSAAHHYTLMMCARFRSWYFYLVSAYYSIWRSLVVIKTPDEFTVAPHTPYCWSRWRTFCMAFRISPLWVCRPRKLLYRCGILYSMSLCSSASLYFDVLCSLQELMLLFSKRLQQQLTLGSCRQSHWTEVLSVAAK